MAVTTAGRVRTVPGVAAVGALILVLAFGNPSYVDWANRHASADSAWGFFLRTLAWPSWSFSSTESVQTLLARDLRAILLVVFTAVFVALLVGSRGSLSQVVAGWAAFIFAGAFAGLIASFFLSHPSLLGAFQAAAPGAVYGLFVGWIIGLITLMARA
jgi:hypothetical protein